MIALRSQVIVTISLLHYPLQISLTFCQFWWLSSWHDSDHPEPSLTFGSSSLSCISPFASGLGGWITWVSDILLPVPIVYKKSSFLPIIRVNYHCQDGDSFFCYKLVIWLKELKRPGASQSLWYNWNLSAPCWKHFPFEKWDIRPCSSQSQGMGSTTYSSGSVGVVVSGTTLASMHRFSAPCIPSPGTQHCIKTIELECTFHFGDGAPY